MTAEATDKKKFPYMSVAAWNQLRRTYQKAAWPTKVTQNGLASSLGWSEKTVRNTLPQLRNMGLLDGDSPTDLARDFRFEDSYPDVCRRIVEEIYPLELREIFPDKDAEVDRVATWIARHSDSGQASAKSQANFYLNLLSADPVPEEDKPKAPRKTKLPASTKPSIARANVDDGSQREGAPVEDPSHDRKQRGEQNGRSDGPSLHIDLQVHIDSSASAEQVDAIFASMAKHLYGR